MYCSAWKVKFYVEQRQMGYLIRPFDFEDEPPQLGRFLEIAIERGGMPIALIDSAESVAVFAFECHRAGTVEIRRENARIWMCSDSTDASVLIDLLDLCIKDAGGKRREIPQDGQALPLPLTEKYIANEARRIRRIAARMSIYFLSVAVLVSTLILTSAWFLMKWIIHAV
jgi:hypothetical protein